MNIKEIKNEENVLKNFKVSNNNLIKLKKRLKTTSLIIAGGLVITSLMGCSSCKNNNEEISVATGNEIGIESLIASEEEAKNEPAEEIYKLQDDAVIACNDAFEAGIDLSYDHQIDQSDIDTYAGQFTNYLIVTNMDNYNNKLFAEMMLDSNVSSEDLIDSFMNLNTVFKKHIITVKNDNLYDFNNLYNKKDAEILNKAEKIIATMNENELNSNERQEAAKEFYKYTTEIINSTNAHMAISPQALDTLVTFIEAYDELTFNYKSNKVKGAYVDDELEHALNISKDSCFGDNNNSELKVEDKVVENFKSLFRTHILKDLNEKYELAKEERILQLQLGNTLNELNSYKNIVTYVKEHIKANLYKPLDYDHETWLKELKGIIAVENNQKSVSEKTGQPYNKTSQEAKKAYEKSVVDRENQKSEQNKYITTANETGKEVPVDGNSTIQSVNGTSLDVEQGYAAGYADGQKFTNNCPAGASDAYKAAYNNGYAAGSANAREKQSKYSGTITTYEKTSEEVVKTEETINEVKPNSSITPSTTGEFKEDVFETFEPIDEEIVNQYEVIETLGCTSTNGLKEQLIMYRNILTGLSEKETSKSFGYRI